VPIEAAPDFLDAALRRRIVVSYKEPMLMQKSPRTYDLTTWAEQVVASLTLVEKIVPNEY
jgi:hypothetical protein